MARLILLLAAIPVVVLSLSPLPAAAQIAARVTGGGTGTFGIDLDGDGDIDGSQFGMGVTIYENGTAKGHFLCLMAGQSDILGLPLMDVAGKVNDGNVNGGGSATFRGVATINLGKGQIIRNVPYEVTVTDGGPVVGTLQLTVIGVFDGVPGDILPGNGNYDLPVETVASGQIRIHNGPSASKAGDTNTTRQAGVSEMPKRYLLGENYPNPFNPRTTLVYETPESSEISLTVYDMLGHPVRVLVEGTIAAGRHEATFEAGRLPSGLYVARLVTPEGTFTRKMLLLK